MLSRLPWTYGGPDNAMAFSQGIRMVDKTQPPFTPAMLETLRTHEKSPYLGGHLGSGEDGKYWVNLTAKIDDA